MFRQAVEIQYQLVRANPTLIQCQRDLAASHNNIGVLLSDTGRSTQALESHRGALEIQERLARDHPAVIEYQNDLASSHNNVGVLLSDTGHRAEALDSYRRAVQIRERLARDNPTVTECQFDLAESHNNMGVELEAMGRSTEAARVVPTGGGDPTSAHPARTRPSPGTRAISPRATTISANCYAIWAIGPRRWSRSVQRRRHGSGRSRKHPDPRVSG